MGSDPSRRAGLLPESWYHRPVDTAVNRMHAHMSRLATLLGLALFLAGGLRAHGGAGGSKVFSAASLTREVPVAPNSIAIVEGGIR